MKRLHFCLLAMLPTLATANVTRDIVTTSRISAASPARYVFLHVPVVTVANATTLWRGVYPYNGTARLVDVIVMQYGAGTVGTSWALDVRNAAGVSLLSTTSVATLASGTIKVTDAKGEIALPSGWTRPVIKTDTTPEVSKGAYLDIYTTESGAYSTHPSMIAVLVFEPRS